MFDLRPAGMGSGAVARAVSAGRGPMELELHQLELRYESLRKRSHRAERQLLSSLAEVGQQMPIVVVADVSQRFVLIDGFKRVRALRRLAHDQVRATVWEVEEAEALVLERLMHVGGEDALSEGWLLVALHERFSLSPDELARRFDRSKSWVSRRLALVRELPEGVQAQVRSGDLSAYAAMKYLVPLARANAETAAQLATAVQPLKLTTRQVGLLYQGWRSGTEKTRELILTAPLAYLRAQENTTPKEKTPTQLLVDDLGALSGICRRARRRLEQGLMHRLLPGEPEEVGHRLTEARSAAESLFSRFDQEASHAQ
jgi:ParB family chromosome partitioning protein